jgi:hypothetical protein
VAVEYVIIWLLFGIAAAVIGGNKGRSGCGFLLLGLLLGPIALAIALIIGPLHRPESVDTRPCPRCAEPIREEARVCRFCGHESEPAAPIDVGSGIGIDRQDAFWLAILCIIIIAGAQFAGWK